jgi:PAS domain S-box-containing protein
MSWRGNGMQAVDRTEQASDGTPVPGSAEQGQRTRALEALYEIATSLQSAAGLPEILQRSLDTLLELFGFSTGVIRLLEPSTGELNVGASSGVAGALADLPSVSRVGDPLVGLAVQQRSVVVVQNLDRGAYARTLWARAGYRTFVATPLQFKGMLLGCINMADRHERTLSPAEIGLLTTLVNQVGLAVANSELYAAAQRKIEYLAALHECSRDVGPAPELERVLGLTAQRMAQLLRLDRTLVLQLDAETRSLSVVAASGFPEAVEGLRFPLAELPGADAALAQRQPSLADDAAGSGLLPRGFAEAQGLRSVLAVPLVAHEEPLGLLVGAQEGRALRPSADEMDLAVIFANQAAVWIASARLLVQERAARARAEAAEARFRDFLEVAPDAILLVDDSGTIRLMNGQAEQMFGYARKELLGQPLEMLLPERFRAAHVGHRTGYQHSPRTRPMGTGLELFGRRKDGSEFPVEISLSPTRTDEGDFIVSVIRDITERNRAAKERERLLASEREKGEQLKLAVREAHHRIKNNLQAISDLLYLEVASGSEVSAREVLQESVERIQSIALVHDMLSQDADVQTVDLRAMVEQLVPMVLRSSGAAGAELQVSVPSVPVSSKKATTLALIINELVSNAAKHGLAGRPDARLQVRLAPEDEGLRLRVRDNGAGLPPGFDLATQANVGLQVVRILAERDLSGKFSLSEGPELEAAVWFPW